MPMIRANALRSVHNALRSSPARMTARAARPARTQLVAKRFASSGGHGGHGEASSDLPWLLSACAITPPACWYLWPDTTHAEHHGDHGEHAEHAEEGEEDAGKSGDEEQSAEDEQPQEDSAPAEQADESEKGAEAADGGEDKGDEKSDGQSEDKSDDKAEDKSEGSDKKQDTTDTQEESKEDEQSAKPSGSQGEAQPNPKKSEAQTEDSTVKTAGPGEKTGNETEGVQFKGKMTQDSAGMADERKSQPSPSKDTRVKRIDSGLGKKLGEGPTYDSEGKETQAQSKEAGSSAGDITQKQKGLSTTDSKHSLQIDQDPTKSQKGSGGPETAKAKGTVDSFAPVKGVGKSS